jgi:hypothetical protein
MVHVLLGVLLCAAESTTTGGWGLRHVEENVLETRGEERVTEMEEQVGSDKSSTTTVPRDKRKFCEQQGLDLFGSSFGKVRISAGALQSGRGGTRAAVCMTGQPRSLPVAWLSWQKGPPSLTRSLFKAIQSGGADLDWFFVGPDGPGLPIWRPFLHSFGTEVCAYALLLRYCTIHPTIS